MTDEQLRKIDALVVEEMGLEVLGEAWASPEVSDWWNVWPEEWEGRTLEPVYLGTCSCDLYPSDTPELDPDPNEKVLGHYVYCLEVVKHYTAWIEAAVTALLDYCQKHDLFYELYNDVSGHGCTLYPRPQGTEPIFGDYAETPSLAICLALLKARGVNVEEER